jgi:hypothetical protein
MCELAALRYEGRVFVPDEALVRDHHGHVALTRTIARADVRARFDQPMLGWVLEMISIRDDP